MTSDFEDLRNQSLLASLRNQAATDTKALAEYRATIGRVEALCAEWDSTTNPIFRSAAGQMRKVLRARR